MSCVTIFDWLKSELLARRGVAARSVSATLCVPGRRSWQPVWLTGLCQFWSLVLFAKSRNCRRLHADPPAQRPFAWHVDPSSLSCCRLDEPGSHTTVPSVFCFTVPRSPARFLHPPPTPPFIFPTPSPIPFFRWLDPSRPPTALQFLSRCLTSFQSLCYLRRGQGEVSRANGLVARAESV